MIKRRFIIVGIYYFIIFVLILHSRLFTETHSKELTFNKLQLKKTLLQEIFS